MRAGRDGNGRNGQLREKFHRANSAGGGAGFVATMYIHNNANPAPSIDGSAPSTEKETLLAHGYVS